MCKIGFVSSVLTLRYFDAMVEKWAYISWLLKLLSAVFAISDKANVIVIIYMNALNYRNKEIIYNTV